MSFIIHALVEFFFPVFILWISAVSTMVSADSQSKIFEICQSNFLVHICKFGPRSPSCLSSVIESTKNSFPEIWLWICVRVISMFTLIVEGKHIKLVFSCNVWSSNTGFSTSFASIDGVPQSVCLLNKSLSLHNAICSHFVLRI